MEVWRQSQALKVAVHITKLLHDSIFRDSFDSGGTVRGLLSRSGCEMTCFCCITGTAIIYSAHEHVFESDFFGFAILTVGTAIVHWLYFDYIC